MTWKTNGRQAICSHRPAASWSSRDASGLPMVQTGRPETVATLAISSNPSPGPPATTMIPAPTSPSAVTNPSSSSRLASRLGTGFPAAPVCTATFDVAKPTAPARMASTTSSRMRSTSVGVASRSLAASPRTESRMGVCPTRAAKLRRGRRRSTASRYSANVSKHQSMPSSSALGAHPLDVLQGADDRRPVLRSHGSNPEPAVADDDRGHPVPARRREVRIPQHLRVVMGVDVDEPRCQHETVEFGDFRPAGVGVPGREDGVNAVAHDHHISGAPRRPSAIDDQSTPDDNRHCSASSFDSTSGNALASLGPS